MSAALCLAAGAIGAFVAADGFTLAWTHSIEQIRWEEDWQIDAGRLVLTAARIRGSGAGMEVPRDAELRGGVWHYRPQVPPLARLELSHSPYATGYTLCAGGNCRPLAELLPGIAATAVIELQPCPAP